MRLVDLDLPAPLILGWVSVKPTIPKEAAWSAANNKTAGFFDTSVYPGKYQRQKKSKSTFVTTVCILLKHKRKRKVSYFKLIFCSWEWYTETITYNHLVSQSSWWKEACCLYHYSRKEVLKSYKGQTEHKDIHPKISPQIRIQTKLGIQKQ